MIPSSKTLTAAIVVLTGLIAVSASGSAPAGRYTAANGTVADAKTKLIWQQLAPAAPYALADAKAYCQGLNLAGTGWRLPTRKEIMSIIDYSRSNPAIDLAAFPGAPAVVFWSSTPLPGMASSAWSVDFVSGSAVNIQVANANVRCVR